MFEFRRVAALVLVAATVSFAVAGCEKGPAEKAGSEIDDAIDSAGNAMDDAADDIRDATKKE